MGTRCWESHGSKRAQLPQDKVEDLQECFPEEAVYELDPHEVGCKMGLKTEEGIRKIMYPNKARSEERS